MLKKMLDFELNLDVDEDRIRAIILFVLCDVTLVLDWIRRPFDSTHRGSSVGIQFWLTFRNHGRSTARVAKIRRLELKVFLLPATDLNV